MSTILSGKNIIQVREHHGPGKSPIGGAGNILQFLALECLKHGASVKVVVDKYSLKAPKNLKSWNRDGLEIIKGPLLKSMPKTVFFLGKTMRRYILAKIQLNQ